MFRKLMGIGFSLLLFGVFAAPNALAMQDMLNFKINKPVEVPGRVLPAGRYSIMDLTPNASLPVVSIVNHKGDSLGTYQLENVQRLNAPSKVIVKTQQQPDAVARLKEFFTPSSNIGYKFEYPHNKPLA